MSLSTVDNDFKRMSGIVDDTTVLAIMNLAAREIWDAVDIPGEQRELRVTTDSQRFVTLPSSVYKLRSVRPVAGSEPMEIVPMGDRFIPGKPFQPYWTWREMYRTPLQTRITNATRLRLRARAPLTTRCVITLGGPTSQGERVYEELTIDVGDQEATTEECYEDIVHLVKSAAVNADIVVTDGAGTPISVIPNHVLAPNYLMIQVRENCAVSTGSCAGCNCFDIYYKPVLPDITALSAYWPRIADGLLLYKMLEHYYLGKDEMIGTAQSYAAKARSLIEQFMKDDAAGKTIRPTIMPSPYITRTGSRL